MQDRSSLLTEQRLVDSMSLDAMSIAEAVALMHRQDQAAVEAAGKEQGSIVRAIELVVAAFRNGGRLLYFGAGTSGRLGVLDASECPPTFRADAEMVQGTIAGGEAAMFRAQEGAEDSVEGGAADVDRKNAGPHDVVMGIAAGGTTPYVHGALRRGRERGAKTVFLSCVQRVANEPEVDVVIRPLTGPEVVTGSTRLKAGTATKIILNQITTLAMVQIGKVYGNLMVDLKASNIKLRDRAARIVATVTGCSREEAFAWVEKAQGHVKVAILMKQKNVDLATAQAMLERSKGVLRVALEQR